jgi:hypothetical protein
MIKGLAHYGSATVNGGFVKTTFEKTQVIKQPFIA